MGERFPSTGKAVLLFTTILIYCMLVGFVETHSILLLINYNTLYPRKGSPSKGKAMLVYVTVIHVLVSHRQRMRSQTATGCKVLTLVVQSSFLDAFSILWLPVLTITPAERVFSRIEKWAGFNSDSAKAAVSCEEIVR